MTCIVGIETDDAVYIGGDSAAGNGWYTRASEVRKVFRHGEFLIGYTDSWRMGQILQYHLEISPQPDDMDVMEYMVYGFVEAVRKCFKDKGFTKVENNTESGGQFLVGYRGYLFDIDSDFQVNRMRDRVGAVGSGLQYALGALGVLMGPIGEDLDCKEKVFTALASTALYSPTVCGPFYVEELKYVKDDHPVKELKHE